MPIRQSHHCGDLGDEGVRDSFMEEVAHGIDENAAPRLPLERLCELFWDEAQIETLLEGMAWNAPEPLGKRLRIAVGAPRADFGASSDGVPSGVGPFDFRRDAHDDAGG